MRRLRNNVLSADVGALFLAGFRWWVGELRAMLLPRVLAWLGGQRPRIDVIFTGEGATLRRQANGASRELSNLPASALAGAAAQAIAAQGPNGSDKRRCDVVVTLPADQVLHRIMKVPPASARNLRQLLTFEIDRQTPFTQDQVYFDYRVVGRDKETKRLAVELVLVKRATAEWLLSVVCGWGLKPTRLRAPGIEGDDWGGELPVPGLAASGSRRERGVALGGIGVALALILALAATEAHRLRAASAALEQALADARRSAQAADKLRKEAANLTGAVEFLPRRKQRPSATRVLNEATRLLPDGTWVFQFELDGREVRVHGFSSAASTLIGLFDGSPLFTNARFRAPLTQGGKPGIERFDLSFELKGGDRP